MCVKLQIEQTQRSKNLRIQSEITERGAVIEGKGQNPSTKRKTGECFQWKAIGSCSKGESCSFRHKPASGNWEVKVESARGSGLKPANERVNESNEQTMKSSASLEDRPATRAKFPARGEQNEKYRHVIFGTLPCVVITSLKADAFMAVIACFDMLMVKRSPERGRRKRVLKE